MSVISMLPARFNATAIGSVWDVAFVPESVERRMTRADL